MTLSMSMFVNKQEFEKAKAAEAVPVEPLTDDEVRAIRAALRGLMADSHFVQSMPDVNETTKAFARQQIVDLVNAKNKLIHMKIL